MLALALGAASCPAWAQAAAQPAAKQPAPTKPAPGASGSPDPAPADELELQQMVRVVAEPATVEELLDALEVADRDVKTFQAQLMLDKRFYLQGDRHVRYGDLYYKRVENPGSAAPGRTFAIDFRTLVVDGARRDERNTWIFDGRWLVERRPAEKKYIARQIAPDSAPLDTLRLDESPMPFPMGQPRAAILERYDAQLLKSHDGLAPPQDADEAEEKQWRFLRESAGDAYQLKLTPRGPFAQESQFTQIRLWYERDTLLPRMAWTTNRADDESIVVLIGGRLNEDVPPHAMKIEPPKDDEGWDVQVESLPDGPG
ncbi:MAG: hypothetical protein SFZ24_07545 [Planctomycetota bacterium]|nr:hypothetical protein [Planctomycetota bacterium]